MLSRSWVSQVPTTTTGVQDKRIWARNPNGKFSVKSAYVIAKEIEQRARNDARGWTSGGGGDEGKWKRIWQINAPMKIKSFLWRCIQNILLVNTALAH